MKKFSEPSQNLKIMLYSEKEIKKELRQLKKLSTAEKMQIAIQENISITTIDRYLKGKVGILALGAKILVLSKAIINAR